MKTIKQRQNFYFLGRKFEQDGKLNEAIEAYKTYSIHLEDVDKHIPYQWISKLYERLNESEKSLIHLEEFAKGCSSPKAAEVYKEIGERYLSDDLTDKAISNFELAMKHNPNIGVKKKLEQLKKN